MAFLDGKYQISWVPDNGAPVCIDCSQIQEIKFKAEEKIIEGKTLCGTVKKPSGSFDTLEVVSTIYLNSFDELGQIFPSMYTAPSGTGVCGQLNFGGASCSSLAETGVLNLHRVCDDNDCNDINLPLATASVNFDVTLNGDDFVTVDITWLGEGSLRLGTSDPTQEVNFNCDTGVAARMAAPKVAAEAIATK